MAYTKAQEARLREEAPVTFARAEELAAEFGVSTQSVISKVQHLGLEYIRKPVAAKRPTPLTKAQVVDLISAQFAEEVDVSGLTGATLKSLVNLYNVLAS